MMISVVAVDRDHIGGAQLALGRARLICCAGKLFAFEGQDSR